MGPSGRTPAVDWVRLGFWGLFTTEDPSAQQLAESSHLCCTLENPLPSALYRYKNHCTVSRSRLTLLLSESEPPPLGNDGKAG